MTCQRRKFRKEADFQDWFLRQLRSIPLSWWSKLNDRATIGLPDIIGAAGPCYAIELKLDSKLTRLQKYTLERMKRGGFKTFVAHPSNADAILTEIRDAASRWLADIARAQDLRP